MKKQLVLLLPIVAAACSGGSGGGSTTAPSAEASFEAYDDLGLALAADLDTLDPTMNLPAAGVASYSGVAVVIPTATATDAYAGALEVDVDFGSERLDGTASNFYYGEYDAAGFAVGPGESVQGSLDYSANSLSESGFIVDVDGQLEVEGVMRSIDGENLSLFNGPGADIVFGAGEANISGQTESGFNVFIGAK